MSNKPYLDQISSWIGEVGLQSPPESPLELEDIEIEWGQISFEIESLLDSSQNIEDTYLEFIKNRRD